MNERDFFISIQFLLLTVNSVQTTFRFSSSVDMHKKVRSSTKNKPDHLKFKNTPDQTTTNYLTN